MSQDFTNPALEQLFRLAPSADVQSTSEEVQAFIEQGGSVFDLLKLGRKGVVDTFGLHSLDAQTLMDKATSLAVHVARQFREQRLVRQVRANPLHQTGITSWVDTPSFDDLFEPDWENLSPADGVGSTISPASYFVKLVMLARALETRAEGNSSLLPLQDRRPDIANLVIDPVSMYQIKSTVGLVSEVLENIIKTFIEAAAFQDHVVDDVLLDTRFPFRSMPFEWYAEQWGQVLKENKLSLGEVVRTIDPTAPYFKQSSNHGNLSDIALRQSCNIGPQGQRLLTENFMPANPPAEQSRLFYLNNYGSARLNLEDSVHFCAQTSIDTQALLSLLSIEDFAPKRSANVSGTTTVSPKVFGSVFINEGAAAAMDLSAPIKNTTRKFENASDNRFERMNRLLRLGRWLELQPDECDRLIVAAITAERRAPTDENPAPATPLRITHNTLRAIGLFQEFRQQYKCTAEQFAALIDEVSPYGRGEQPSQFDRIFNVHSGFDTPLRVDGHMFAIDPQTDADKLVVNKICESLGFNGEAWRYLARFVAKSHNQVNQLPCSLAVLSSFYRIALLASFLKVNVIELAAMLEALSDRGAGELLQAVLSESRVFVSGVNHTGDILSVLHAAPACIEWCRDNLLTVPWLVQHLAPVIAPPMATESNVALVQEVHKRLLPVRLSEEALHAAGVPANSNPDYDGWLHLLEELVDRDGLVLSLVELDNYEGIARGEIEAAVTLAGVPDRDVESACTAILALLLQARDAQNAVVQESLSVYLNMDADLVLPLLKWVDKGGNYLLLRETIRALNAVTSGSDQIKLGDDVLTLLALLERRADVVKKLALSSAMLVALTTRQNWQWLGLKYADELSLGTMYYLTLFQRMVTHTGQPAEKLLHYLELVNALPEYLTPEDLRLIRDSAASELAEVVQWGVREVLECTLYLSSSKPIVMDLPTLDTLIRIRGLAVRSGMDAKAIIQLGLLTHDTDKGLCRSAAEQVLQSLSESSVDGHDKVFGELGQSVTHTVRCINDTLIANVNGQFAQVELTLRDLTDQVLPNITVSWTCDRVGLLEQTSFSDYEGRAVVRFKPVKGPWMGVVQVKGTYGLGQVVYAPKILIDCDEASLGFSISDVSLPEGEYLAGGEGYFSLFIRLRDVHGNPGRGRAVTFAGRKGLIVDPLVVLTDEDGFARTRIKSTEPVANASVVASYSDKDPRIITGITFVDRPSVRLMEVTSMAVVGQPLIIRCEVVGLGKLPSKDAVVKLYSDAAPDTEIGSVTTGVDGIATFTVSSPTAGPQIYIARVQGGERRINVYVASEVRIHGESVDYAYPVADSGTPSLLWVETREAAHNQARLVANCPIWWTVTAQTAGQADRTVVEAVNYPTDALGRSTFPFEVETAGDYLVTADRRSTPEDKRTFTLRVVPAINWAYTLTDTTTNQTQTSAPLAFIRGHDYTLDIDLPPGVNLTDARAMLVWNGDYSAKGLGMIFTPATGAYVVIGDKSKLSWDIDCKDLRNGAFDLTFFCNRLDQRLVLSGRLDAPPPVVLAPVNNATVELWPLLSGTGSPSAQIYVFEGRAKDAPVLGSTSVGDDGKWALRPSKPLSAGPHVLSVKQRHVDTTEAWAADVNVIVSADATPMVVTTPASNATVEIQPLLMGTGSPRGQVSVFAGREGAQLGRTYVGDDGKWYLRVAEPMTAGAHVLSVKQQREDSTQTWAADISVTVNIALVSAPIVLSPAPGSTVQTESWAEGLALPNANVEVRMVQPRSAGTIYAQGMVNSDGRWRIQFNSILPVSSNVSISVGTYVDGIYKLWLSPDLTINVVYKS